MTFKTATNKIFFSLLPAVLILSTLVNYASAQNNSSKKTMLNAKEQAIVSISAYTATGAMEKLKTALNKGLDAGLTINEIKELQVQLYAYAGFPRSLNGLTAFMQVVDERKKKGLKDAGGKEASPIKDTTNRYDAGKKTLESLTGKPETGPKKGYAAFAPVIEVFLKEHLFADIFSRDVLDYRQRELTTISALMSMPGLDAQLQSHLAIGLHLGFTEAQLNQVADIIGRGISKQQGDIGKATVLKAVKAITAN